MLDIRSVRENPDAVRENLRRRKDDEKLAWVDEILAQDALWRKLKAENDELRAQRNRLSEEINRTKKQGGDVAQLIAQVKRIPDRIRELDERMDALQAQTRRLLMRLPNLMHESVPYGKDDSQNVTVKEFGSRPAFAFAPRTHAELVEALNVVDLERAAKIAGSRFYFLQGDLALLEHALEAYALRFMAARGYVPVMPPHMMNRAAYEGVTDLADFEEVLYKIEGEDLHLIATSEHPLTAQFKDETLDAASLPIRLVGISPCYRKETGTHGKEEKGIWRVHHFMKIEQIVIARQEQSWELHEEITRNAIDFFSSLGLHFRQVLICTGDLGTVAAKKYDLEAWIPSVQAYKEVVSSSNCTAYQAVRLNIRYRERQEYLWAHTLNSTCVATSRALAAIVEQGQQADGSVMIPPVLREFMGGKEKLSPVKRF